MRQRRVQSYWPILNHYYLPSLTSLLMFIFSCNFLALTLRTWVAGGDTLAFLTRSAKLPGLRAFLAICWGIALVVKKFWRFSWGDKAFLPARSLNSFWSLKLFITSATFILDVILSLLIMLENCTTFLRLCDVTILVVFKTY